MMARPVTFPHILLAVLTALCLLGAVTAHAQESVLQVPTAPDTLLAAPSSGQTIKDYATRFYKRCMGKPSPYLTAAENDEHCTCLSAQLYRKSLTDDERAFLTDGTGGRMDPKRATSEFYGQCIGVPGRAATYHHCTHTPDIFKFVKGADELKAMCECVNIRMADYWDREAPAFIEYTLRSRRSDKLKGDLITSIIQGRDFPARYAEERSECVRQYGRRD